MAQQSMLNPAPEIVLSFRHFINYLKERRDGTECSKGRFFNYVVEQFEQHPELLGEIDVNEIQKYSEQLQLIYNTLSPIVEDEKLHRWALCMPLRPVIFYSTDAYFNLVANIATGQLQHKVVAKDPEEIRRKQLEVTYSLILEKFYNMPSFFKREIVHSLQDEETGRLRYYKLNLDTRFVEVTNKQPLPELSLAALQSAGHESEHILPILEKMIPLDIFKFEGFAINNVTDVTAEHAIDNIKNILLNHNTFDDEKYYFEVIDSLKTLAGNNDIEFGVLPALKVNNRLIFADDNCMNSKLILVSKVRGVAESTYMSLVDGYFKAPKLLFYRELTDEITQKQEALRFLKEEGIASYALVPVFFNNTITGVLEVYSNKKGLMDEALLSRLEPAIPLLAQLLKNNTEQFKDDIDKVIKEKFTSIQPSVQWKFNEVAWHYLRDNKAGDPENIDFKDVHALYGAIDIRNSTIERNAALHKDLETQFAILLTVLEKLKVKSGFGLIDAKIFIVKQWLEKIRKQGFRQEVEVNDFVEVELTPFLIGLKEGNAEYASIMDEYFDAINEETGVGYENRRRLEKSMNKVISSVNQYLEKMKGEVQQAYPSYFEKFRTDGVEYDIYIGQS
ncbi:MAG: GAF domain-containing protein, partial [Chitinophagaceae bacterium]